MRHLTLTILLLLTLQLTMGREQRVRDSIVIETVEVTTIKQRSDLRQEPLSSTVIGGLLSQQQRIEAISDLATIAPNFYMPDYGSRITSSIYVRGIGARIDQPVVGLNIDNVPYLNKNGFDSDVMDISRMEILRGPQSTLYGRNTMCGVVNIYTLSPIDFEGVKVGAEYANGNSYRLRGSLYNRVSDIFALSASAYYHSSDGLFTNDYTGERCDSESEVGGRLRIIHYPTSRTTIDNTLSFSILDQGGYPYRNLESDVISYNDICAYERTMVNNGLTISHRREAFTISAITGYQYLDDMMTLDQDFSSDSIFTLKQAIREHSLTEDIVLRSNSSSDKYSYLFGLFGLFRDQKMRAPVTFEQQGIEELIFANVSINAGEYYVSSSDSYLLDSDINTRTLGAALYHQSSLNLGRWSLTAGLRLDWEQATLDYRSVTDSEAIRYNSDGEVVWVKDLSVDLSGNPSQHFLELLPKVSATYNINSRNNLYATIAKGYKAGGYNTQMFSDILQQELMNKFGLSQYYDAEDIISYQPEYSWNYEVGAHLANKNNTLTADIALFYIDCRDQQLTILPPGAVTGRMMTNAGKSRSYGAELSAMARYEGLTLRGSYGYTNAKFVEYDDGTEDYSGNYIPYAPSHTLFASLGYSIPLRHKWAESLELEVNTNGAGKIYWREDNALSQPFYALLGSSLTLQSRGYSLSLWGRNITNKEYYTFYFESMGNEFVQQARPVTFGATLNITINKN